MRTRSSFNAVKDRRGMAPLEFVMGLPFLMLLFGFIFMLGRVTLEQSDSAIVARYEGWKDRSDQSTWADDELSVVATMTADTGRAMGDGKRSVKVYSWLGGTIDTNSTNVVLSGTWDSDQVQTFNEKEPHFKILEKMLGGNGAVADFARDLIHTLLSMGSLPNQGEIDQAEKDKNEKKDELEKKQQEMQDQIDKLKDELNELIAERKELQSQYDEKNAERQELIDKQTELREQAATFPAGSPERSDLLAQANLLQSDIQTLTDDMSDLSTQIGMKNGEIAEKREEIRVIEDAKQQSQAEIDKLPQ
ncbi:coiled-coil domain-containing protein [Neorhodopirellula pilleata]|uniref:Uncharacterized protein n=1 Tax=Neorhodopirellula pilleata TaxID=2714738 RepID=A0A5C6AXC4_9BACT|nr:hypothetical protein [Neorhodopirellula pilleata]TWU03692.1 hypothetical protein Pla100_06220 [Neorhodopirellula pilleata]